MSDAKKPILSIDSLSTCFDATKVVDDLSLDLYAGETLALVGESGSGKSVTAHSILRLLPYPKASHPTGRIQFNELDLLHCTDKQIRQVRHSDIGMIFQEPMTALNPLQTIEKQILESLSLSNTLSKNSKRETLIELLESVMIQHPEDKLNRYPHELSGGQRQRVMIAMAIANKPKVLIADEPTTALDVTVQAEILQLLKQLQISHELTILLITHDLGVVKHVADRVAVMKSGKIVESGNTLDVFTNPQHSYTQALLNTAIQTKNPAPSG